MGSLAQADSPVAIITGSTSGIGHDLAKHMLAQGYRVALTGRRVDRGEAVAKELDPEGIKVIFVSCDVASYSAQAALFKAVWKQWSRIDVFVANAGFVDRGSLYDFAGRSRTVDDLPAEPDLSCTDTNFKGVVYGTTLATHFMRHNPSPGGKVIVTGSMIGVHPCPTFPEYCSTKAGVHHWVRTMAPVLAQQENITINCVMPGAFDTPAMPGFSVAFLPEHLTLKECLMEAYDEFLKDTANTVTGKTVETGHDKLYYYDVPDYKSGGVSYRNTLVYEPWFNIIHGGKSELGNALQSSPREGKTES